VLIDFAGAPGSMAWLEVCRSRKIPMIIGSTGHDETQLDAIRAAAGEIPIVKASNFSIGVHAVMELVGKMAAMLGRDFDVEVVETHHRHKVDAPSGTARSLVDRIVAASEGGRGSRVIHGRAGQVGERTREEIGVHAVRMGEIIGQHEVHFSGPGETITLRHVSHSRATYAAGALQAAAWLIGRPPAHYTMEDVMGAE
jgi:4-hydroxy-tetrahydrodipicolinate reductase